MDIGEDLGSPGSVEHIVRESDRRSKALREAYSAGRAEAVAEIASLKAAVEEERKLVAVHKGLSDGKSLVISQLEAAVEEARGALTAAARKRIERELAEPYTGGIWEGRKFNEEPFAVVRASDLRPVLDALAKLPALNAATLSGETGK